MSAAIIITLCVLLLLAYLFDISSSRTKVPSVILLLLLGWGVREVTSFLQISIPNLNPILPILGTVGLILIVLEGSLELEVNKSKTKLIAKSFFMSIVPMFLLAFALAFVFHLSGDISLRRGLINAVPLTIISSAIAIPSVKSFVSRDREFVTYETSLSDIIGVIFFNFLTLNDNIGTLSFGYFLIDLVTIIVISIVSTILLIFLLGKIKHHVKFIPIIVLIILIYSISKIIHLPALILILVFGLFLGNLNSFEKNRFIHRLQPEVLEREIVKFKELTSEVAFLIRALFFLLFGYLIETSELLNLSTLGWSLLITFGIFFIRAIFLRMISLPLQPFLFIAPRGLITILLFLSIPVEQFYPLVSRSMIIQVIILTSLLMMVGTIKSSKKASLE